MSKLIALQSKVLTLDGLISVRLIEGGLNSIWAVQLRYSCGAVEEFVYVADPDKAIKTYQRIARLWAEAVKTKVIEIDVPGTCA